MPTLPAPYPFFTTGGDLPVASTDDVLAAYPARVRDVEAAPVRDAVVEAQTALFLAHQERVDHAAAQSDPTRATGSALKGHGQDRGVFAQEGEDEEAYRDRIFTVPAEVTPPSIIDAVNAILAPYTTQQANLFESITDRWFVGDGSTTEWHSFIGDGTVDVSPDYPDRRYAARPGSSPGGAWAFADGYGRLFVLRVPDISGSSENATHAFDGTQPSDPGTGMFVDDGSDPDGSDAAFVFPSGSDVDGVYQAIINTVEKLRGHGVRWTMVIEKRQ